jgi:thiol-disulfide isomerase/thioredoxin
MPARPDDETALIDFFATWCAPCKPQMAELRTIQKQFPELHMLSVTREDDESAVKQFWETYDGTWPVGVDPSLQLFQHYEVTNVPTKLLLDSGGEIAWRHIGLATAETIASAIAELD